MRTFQQLKEFRSYFACLPGIKTCKDFDIAIEIGHYQQMGQPLTMKQLLLLNIAPPASMRRHLERMIKEGTIEKHASDNDLRIVYFTLSNTAIHSFKFYLEQVQQALFQTAEEPETVHQLVDHG